MADATEPEPTSDPPSAETQTAASTDAAGKNLPGAFQRLFKSLRRGRNGDHLRDTIEELIEETDSQSETMAPDERQLIRNILSLHQMTVHDVMVPRADIIALEITTPLGGLIKLLNEETHSRIPVYRGSLDDTIGMVHIKDLLPFWSARRGFNLEKIVRGVIFVAPSMSVLDLLAEMRAKRQHLALVVDEFGGVDGLVTIEDLVEEIVGEIEDEHDDLETPQIEESRPGIAMADARAGIEDLENLYGPIVTDDEREDVDTLGGLVFHLANRVPARGELISHSSGIELEVIEADPRRVHRLRLRNLPTRKAETENGK
jgi:CBS domain containing-hemolysin-like protein